jgi:hypothetical protein
LKLAQASNPDTGRFWRVFSMQLCIPDLREWLVVGSAVLKKFDKSDAYDFFAEIDFRHGRRFCR